MPTFPTFEWTVLSILIAGVLGTWGYLQQLESLLRTIGTTVALLLPENEASNAPEALEDPGRAS